MSSRRNHALELLALLLVSSGCSEPRAPEQPSAGVGGGLPIAGAAASASGAGTGGAGAAFVMPTLRPELYDGPALLSDTGLYADIAAGTVAAGVREYKPLAELWSDGAVKRRWLQLPAGAVIDTTNMDDWIFPVGTRVWKEFARDGVRVETRLIWKRGPSDWPMVAYLWNPEQSEAYAAPDGLNDAGGTLHDVPDAGKCARCHDGRTDRLLGATALQLSRPGPLLTMDTLIAENLLSRPPAAPLVLPGDAHTQAALAYLHANCGHCHNPNAPDSDRYISVHFWQEVASLGRLQDTVTYRSLVADKGSALWIDAVIERMADRGGKQQMPPFATEDVDVAGMTQVSALMNQLRQAVPALPAPMASGGSCPNTQPVFEAFEQAGCTRNFCHGTQANGLYWSTPEELQTVMIAMPPQGDGCGDVAISRVEPGHPERSLLYLKLLPGPPCGTVMPPQLATLTQEQIQQVYDWIMGCTDAGAE